MSRNFAKLFFLSLSLLVAYPDSADAINLCKFFRCKSVEPNPTQPGRAPREANRRGGANDWDRPAIRDEAARDEAIDQRRRSPSKSKKRSSDEGPRNRNMTFASGQQKHKLARKLESCKVTLPGILKDIGKNALADQVAMAIQDELDANYLAIGIAKRVVMSPTDCKITVLSFASSELAEQLSGVVFPTEDNGNSQ